VGGTRAPTEYQRASFWKGSFDVSEIRDHIVGSAHWKLKQKPLQHRNACACEQEAPFIAQTAQLPCWQV
jgi:hypothetical protein